MSYQIRRAGIFGAFGAFTTDDQKAVCEANAPSGAYWNQSLDMCSGLTQDGAMMMCTASGGTWDVNQGCMCNGQANIDANFIGCPAATGQAPLPVPQGPVKIASTTKQVLAKKYIAPVRTSGSGGGGSSGGGGGGGEVSLTNPSTFPWMWVVGGAAIVGLGAAAYFMTR